MFDHWSGHIEDNAKLCANNHAKFTDFGWDSDAQPDDKQNWAIIYTHNRDSCLLEESNAAAIAKALESWAGDHKDGFDVEHISHGHWAVGHVDGILIRVYREDGQTITEAFGKLHELACSLADYPVLDEDDWSEREFNAELESIEQTGKRLVRDDAPEGWPSDVHHWIGEHYGDMGSEDGYVPEERVEKALEALGLLEPEESEG